MFKATTLHVTYLGLRVFCDDYPTYQPTFNPTYQPTVSEHLTTAPTATPKPSTTINSTGATCLVLEMVNHLGQPWIDNTWNLYGDGEILYSFSKPDSGYLVEYTVCLHPGCYFVYVGGGNSLPQASSMWFMGYEDSAVLDMFWGPVPISGSLGFRNGLPDAGMCTTPPTSTQFPSLSVQPTIKPTKPASPTATPTSSPTISKKPTLSLNPTTSPPSHAPANLEPTPSPSTLVLISDKGNGRSNIDSASSPTVIALLVCAAAMSTFVAIVVYHVYRDYRSLADDSNTSIEVCPRYRFVHE